MFRSIAIAAAALTLALLGLSPAPAGAQGLGSCTGTDACTGANLALIGTNACNGNQACRDLQPTGLVQDSCNGDFACVKLQPQGTTVDACNGFGACWAASFANGLKLTLGTNACKGAGACQTQNQPDGVAAVIGPNSCNGQAACAGWRPPFGTPGGSCNGFFACQAAEGPVGTTACNGSAACQSRFGAFSVGNRACVGDRACAGGRGNILVDSCNGFEACRTTAARIGTLSCNGDDVCELGFTSDIPDCARNAVPPAGCPNADVRVTVTDNSGRARQGSPVAYTIVASNRAGQNTDPDVSVAATFPAELTNCSVTSSATGGAAGNDAGPSPALADTGVSLPGGGTVTYTANCDLHPAATGTLNVGASIASSTLDPAPFDNAAADVDVLAFFVTAFATVASGDGTLDADEEIAVGATQLLVGFSGPMSNPPGDATPGDVTGPLNYRVVAAGANETIDTAPCAAPFGDDVGIAVASVLYDAPAARAAVVPAGTLALAEGKYRVDACATLLDLSDYAIVPASRSFEVLGSDRLSQPNFDVDLAGWTVVDPAPVSLQWSAADAGGASTSGSARLDTTAGQGLAWRLSQCVAVADRYFVARGRMRVVSAEPGSPTVRVGVQHFASADCSGAPLAARLSPAVEGDTAGEWLATSVEEPVPATAQSARVDAVYAGGAASTFTVDVDDMYYGDPESHFLDGFE